MVNYFGIMKRRYRSESSPMIECSTQHHACCWKLGQTVCCSSLANRNWVFYYLNYCSKLWLSTSRSLVSPKTEVEDMKERKGGRKKKCRILFDKDGTHTKIARFFIVYIDNKMPQYYHALRWSKAVGFNILKVLLSFVWFQCLISREVFFSGEKYVKTAIKCPRSSLSA